MSSESEPAPGTLVPQSRAKSPPPPPPPLLRSPQIIIACLLSARESGRQAG